jgi:UDP-N-acetylmuramate dehydrogenase
MRLGGIAKAFAEIHSRSDLQEAYDWAHEHDLPVIIIGGGSNIVWKDSGFEGLVLVNKIGGYSDATSDDLHTLTIGAGESWDTVVARSVATGLTGIESLSLIPGSAGATPVQNVGAYGQEIAQTLQSLEAFDTTNSTFVTLDAVDCGFGYRTSIFKTTERGRYWIVSLTLLLRTGNPLPPYYGAIQRYLEQNPTDEPITPALVREAVIAIRSAKLPNVAEVANNGSFFANPLISEEVLTRLLTQHPDMPHWPLDGGGAKIPAAWLIEQAGFKDFHDADTGMGTWPHQPLVLVNEHARTTADLLTFRDRITTAVQTKFGIALAQEPELLPN